MRKGILSLLLLLVALCLVSCMSHQPFRPNINKQKNEGMSSYDIEACEENYFGTDPNRKECKDSAFLKYLTNTQSEFHLAFAEFDDQGLLHNPKNVKSILNKYKTIVENSQNHSVNGIEQSVIFLVYVHGWHHSARYDDNNVEKFRDLLNKAATFFNPTNTVSGEQRKKVIGLYVGWRGDSIELPILDMATFFDRKNTAHEIGTQGLSALMLQIEDVMKVQKNGTYQQQNKDKLISIGHSFGAAALFSATGPLLAERVVNSSRFAASGKVKGFGDLTILLNPAFEAMKTLSLFQLYQNDCMDYGRNQPPRLVTLSSDADWPVKNGFPIGRRLGIMFEEHSEDKEIDYCFTNENQRTQNPGIRPKNMTRKIDSYFADIRSVTHFGPLVTHDMTLIKVKPNEKTDCPESSELDKSNELMFSNFLGSENPLCPNVYDIRSCEVLESFQVDRDSYKQLINNDLECKPSNDEIVLRVVPRFITHPSSPFMNILVSEDIMPGHNEIWGPAVQLFFLSMLDLTVEDTSLQMQLQKLN